MPPLAHMTLSALRRLDVLIAAGLGGYCIGTFAQAWLCEDTFCTSRLDRALYVSVVLLGAVGVAIILWLRAHRWWSRALAVTVAAYAALVVPPVAWGQGRWTLQLPAGAKCKIPGRAAMVSVRRDCGSPSYSCIGPKFIASESLWNPFAIGVCGFQGDVYGTRLVTYDCGGLVYTVEAFTPPQRPQGCVIQQ